MLSLSQNTVNVEIFAQYISCRALDARKFNVSEKINYNSTNRINCSWCEYLITQKCLLGFNAKEFSGANISKFTVDSVMAFGSL